MSARTSKDLTKGIYRKIYSCAIAGERINSVSERAELLFWRLHMVADDWGNFDADPKTLRFALYPKRKVTPTQIEQMLQELIATAVPARGNGKPKPALLTLYEVDGNWYGHINDFERFQPRGPNGKPVHKVPLQPDQTKEIQNRPENPDDKQKQKQAGRRHDQKQEQGHAHADGDQAGGIAGGTPACLPEPAEGETVLAVLECCGVEEPNLRVLAAARGLTPALVRTHWAQITGRGAAIDDPVGVLVRTLAKVTGTELKGGKLRLSTALAGGGGANAELLRKRAELRRATA